MSDCPYCAEHMRRGCIDSLIAMQYQMATNNAWSTLVTEMLGYETAVVMAAKVSAMVEEMLDKEKQ